MNFRLLSIISLLMISSSHADDEIFDIQRKCSLNNIEELSYKKTQKAAKCIAKYCDKNLVQCSSLSLDVQAHWYQLNISKFMNDVDDSIQLKLHKLSEWYRLENIALVKGGLEPLKFNKIKSLFIDNFDVWDGHIVKSLIENNYYNEELFYKYYTEVEPGVMLVKTALAKNESEKLLTELKSSKDLDPLMTLYSPEKVLDLILSSLESDLLTKDYLELVKASLENSSENVTKFRNTLIKIADSQNQSPINSIIDSVFPFDKSFELWPFVGVVSNKELSGDFVKSLVEQNDFVALLDYLKLITKSDSKKLKGLFNLLQEQSSFYNEVLINYPGIILSHGQVENNENTAEFLFLNHLYANKSKIKKETLKLAISNLKVANSSSNYYILNLAKDVFERDEYVKFVSTILLDTENNSVLSEFIPGASLEELNQIFSITEANGLDIWQVVNNLSLEEGNIKAFVAERLSDNSLGSFRLTFLMNLVSDQLKLLSEKGNTEIIKEFVSIYLRDQASFNLQRNDVEAFLATIKSRSDVRLPRRLTIKLKKSLDVANTNLLGILQDISESTGDYGQIETVDQMNLALESIAKIIGMSRANVEVKNLSGALVRLEDALNSKETEVLEAWTEQFYRLIELSKNSLRSGIVKDVDERSLLGKLSLLYRRSTSSKSKNYIKDALKYSKLSASVRQPLTRNLNSALVIASAFKYSLATTDKGYLSSLKREELDSLKAAVELYTNLPVRIAENSDVDQNASDEDILRTYFSSFNLYFNTFKDMAITGLVKCDQGSECFLKFEKRKNISSTTAIRSDHQEYNQRISYGEYLATNELGKDVSSSLVKVYKSRNLEVKGYLNDVLLVDASYLKTQKPDKPLNGRNAAPPVYGTRLVWVEYCKTRIKFGIGSMCIDRGVRQESQTYIKVQAKVAHPGRDAIIGSDSAKVSLQFTNSIAAAPFASVIILNSPSDASEPAKGGAGCGSCGGVYAQPGKDGLAGKAGQVGPIVLNSRAKQFPLLQLNKRTADPVIETEEDEEGQDSL